MQNQRKSILLFTALVLLAGMRFWWPKGAMRSETTAGSGLPTTRQPVDRATVTDPMPTTLDSPDSGALASAVSGSHQFADLNARERRAITEKIRGFDLATIFQLFLDAGRIEHDQMKQSAIQGIMTQAITEQPVSPELLSRRERFITDSSNSNLERGSVISAFGSAGTKDGANFVMWAATNQEDRELRNVALSNLSNLGGGGTRPYLPAMLKPLWTESNDSHLLKAVAIAMAQEGAPSSIELLLPAAAAPARQDDVRRDAAAWALTKVYTKNAVPPLAAALDKSQLGSPTHRLAFTTLSQIVDESAAPPVISWLQEADERAAPLALQWVSQARHVPQLQVAEAALDPAVPFRSEQYREAIRAGLAAYRAARTSQ